MITAAEQGNRRAIRTLAGLPVVPPQVRYLWEYFNDLDLTRDNYGWGPTRLKHREILAWSINRKITLDPWELDTLLSLDSLYLSINATKAAPNGS